jgi:hypothetical protein
VGNAFGGYDCVCGNAWLDTYGTCVGPNMRGGRRPAMADLHERLTAAHLELAQAAKGIGQWAFFGWGTTAEREVSTRVRDHMLANDPDHVIRACRADLERLEVHRRNGNACEACWTVTSERTQGVPWPCPEVRRIATVYGVDLR